MAFHFYRRKNWIWLVIMLVTFIIVSLVVMYVCAKTQEVIYKLVTNAFEISTNAKSLNTSTRDQMHHMDASMVNSYLKTAAHAREHTQDNVVGIVKASRPVVPSVR